jgi:16S rRNA (cytosine1402-N4)-methyltransferase
MTQEQKHIPVLLKEVLYALMPNGRAPDRVIDGTLGAGGHSAALLKEDAGALLGMDVDSHALDLARQRLSSYSSRVTIVQQSYVHMRHEAGQLSWLGGERPGVDAILLDLGLSSMQLDNAERGFAFMQDGPLDMRFNPGGDHPPAADIVNYWEADALADLFFRYGEEKESRRYARAIVEHRPFSTTRELADVIEQAAPRPRKAKGKGRGKGDAPKSIHPATRIFQALRIAVNDELRSVETVLPDAISLLRRGGRLAVISFHSLEDRIVKQTFKEAATEIKSPPGMQLREKVAVVRLVNRKPITATETEIALNPRSRSAKLRVVEKL